MRNKERIRRFIDGELEPREETELLREAADDPELGEALQAELELREALRDTRDRTSEPPPAGFADRLMSELHRNPPERPPLPWYRWLMHPVPIRARLSPAALLLPIGALALVALVAYRIGQAEVSARPPDLQSEPIAELELGATVELPVRFILQAAGAASVAVAGDFNGWSVERDTLLDPDGDGVFVGTVRIPRGSHAYMFVIDGKRWVSDPNATNYREDGFGYRNAILRID